MMNCRFLLALSCAVVWLAASVSPAHARLGDTHAQLAVRYGTGTDQGNVLLYDVGDFTVTVYCNGDCSQMEIYSKVNRAAAAPGATPAKVDMAASDVNQLLRDGYPGGWIKLKENESDIFWRSQDGTHNGKAQARFSKGQQILTIRLLDVTETKFDKKLPKPAR